MNYCEYFADAARTAFSGLEIYSNVDPSREWNGTATLEFNEPDEPKTRTLISGAAIAERTIYAIVRAASLDDLETWTASLLDFCVASCETLQSQGSVYSWAIDGSGTTADVRGIVEGESFYGYVELTLIERTKNGVGN